MKRKMIKWEKTFANHISNKKLISKIYKEFVQLKSKKQTHTQTKKNSNKEKQLKNWDPNRVHECLVAELCLILFDPMEYSLPGPSVHEILQARTLQQGAISSSRESSRPTCWSHDSCISCIGRRILYHWAPGKPRDLITNYQGNSNQNLNEVLPYTC